MACKQACPHNTLYGCKVKEHSEICPLTNTETPITEYKMTNADRIRAMTDEEMVEWAHKQIGCGFEFFPCGIVCEGKCEAYSKEACDAKILKWLQQPAEEKEGAE